MLKVSLVWLHYLDVDECAENIDDCEGDCKNEDGCYTCLCPAGKTLAADNVTCDGGWPNNIAVYIIDIYLHVENFSNRIANQFTADLLSSCSSQFLWLNFNETHYYSIG